MNHHPFDPISAVLGVLAVAVGGVVALGTINPVDGIDLPVWITLAALVVGLLLLPTGWRRDATDSAGDDPVAERSSAT